MVELPLTHLGDEREIRYQYLTLVHGHRIVNGSSGYTPALTQWLYSEDQSPLADANHPGTAVDSFARSAFATWSFTAERSSSRRWKLPSSASSTAISGK